MIGKIVGKNNWEEWLRKSLWRMTRENDREEWIRKWLEKINWKRWKMDNDCEEWLKKLTEKNVWEKCPKIMTEKSDWEKSLRRITNEYFEKLNRRHYKELREIDSKSFSIKKGLFSKIVTRDRSRKGLGIPAIELEIVTLVLCRVSYKIMSRFWSLEISYHDKNSLLSDTLHLGRQKTPDNFTTVIIRTLFGMKISEFKFSNIIFATILM